MKLLTATVPLLLATSALASPLSLRTTNNCATASSGISSTRAQTVRSAFKNAKIITDSVPDFTPTTEVRVTYGNKALELGNDFGPAETLSDPSFAFAPESNYDPATTKYTYIVVDPDAPGPELPLLRHFLHLITYDNQPSCIAGQSPKTLARYMPLTPLSVATHRYVYLVYRQPAGQFNPQIDPITQVARAPFNLQQFVDKYKLTLVGGNFMREGLSTALVGVIPGATLDGTGYNGPLDGTAEPADGIGNLLGL